MSDTHTENDGKPRRALDDYLAPVHFIPRREEGLVPATSGSDGLGDYVSMEEYQDALDVAQDATQPVYRPRFEDQMAASLDSVGTIPTAEGTARLVFVGQVLMMASRQLDMMLPPGRHKSLCMTHLEDAAGRARMALLCDEGNATEDDYA